MLKRLKKVLHFLYVECFDDGDRVFVWCMVAFVSMLIGYATFHAVVEEVSKQV